METHDPAFLKPVASQRLKAYVALFAVMGVVFVGTTIGVGPAEIRAGFGDIAQGAFGLWFKFVGENVPYMILPAFVLYAIYVQINYLTRRVAIGELAAGGGTVEAGTQAGSWVSLTA
jgi:hypothetical protein